MTNLPQSVQDFIKDLTAVSPELGKDIEGVCITCFMAGQLEETRKHRLEMAQMLNDTIPDNADLSLTAPFRSEVI